MSHIWDNAGYNCQIFKMVCIVFYASKIKISPEDRLLMFMHRSSHKLAVKPSDLIPKMPTPLLSAMGRSLTADTCTVLCMLCSCMHGVVEYRNNYRCFIWRPMLDNIPPKMHCRSITTYSAQPGSSGWTRMQFWYDLDLNPCRIQRTCPIDFFHLIAPGSFAALKDKKKVGSFST